MRTKLKNRRTKQGLTQAQLAKKASLTERSYQRIEQGKQDPRTTKSILIADALKIKSYKDFKALFGSAPPKE